MGVISGVNADVYVAANPSTALGAPEQATDSGDHQNYTMSVHKYWDERVPPVVQTSATLGGAYATVTNYTFQYAGGVIVFSTPNSNTYVRVQTGNYFLVTECGDCKDWSLALTASTVDTTTFQNSWKLNTAVQPSGKATINSFRVDDRLAKELTNLLILVLYMDTVGKQRWEMMAFVTDVTTKSAMTGVVEQALSFDLEGPAYYRTT